MISSVEHTVPAVFMAMAKPIEQFESLKSSTDFLFLVYYRGHWCPFCVAYLKDFQSLAKDIAASGGKAVVATAEPIDNLALTTKAAGYTGEAIVDPENILAEYLQHQGILDVAISPKTGYPNGMAQPAVLITKRDGTVLYKWATVPSLMNIGGAKDRPSLREIWNDIHAQLRGIQQSGKAVYSTQTFRAVMWQKVFG